MDGESVKEFLDRAGERNKILDTLNTSVMSDCDRESESTMSNKTDSAPIVPPNGYVLSRIPFVDSANNSLSELEIKENVEPEKPASPLKARFARLSAEYRTFEIDVKTTKPPKENPPRGPVKRLSNSRLEGTAQKSPAPKIRVMKKPAAGEIVSGPSFHDSLNYWKNREIANPYPKDDPVVPVEEKPKQPVQEEKKVPVLPQVFEEPDDDYSETLNKSTQQQNDDSNVVDESDNNDVNDSTCLSSWNEKFKIKSYVVTESFDERVSESGSTTSLTVPSESFVFQRPPPAVSAVPIPETEPVPQVFDATKSSLWEDIHSEVGQIQSSAVGLDMNETSDSSRLAHSLSHYRRNEVLPKVVATPRKKDPISGLVASKQNDNKRYISEEHKNARIKRLEEMVGLQYSQISQMGAALTTLRRTGKYVGTMTEVDCLQKITIAQERRRACYLESNRLADEQDPYYLVPRARLRFNKVTVYLCPGLTAAANHDVYIFVLFRHKDEVYATEPVFVNDYLSRGPLYVDFCKGLTIENVSVDFTLVCEVFGVTLVRREKNEKSLFKKILASPAPDRPQSVHAPDQFSRIGHMTLNYTDLRDSQDHYLSFVEFPIESRINFNYSVQVTDTDDSSWSGFISIYRVVDGRGAWELNYGKLVNGRLKLWRYPEDADVKQPILSLHIRDMERPAYATNDEQIGFQYDFVMHMIDSKDTVVRIMLSTSEEDERERVMAVINRSYNFLKAWDKL